MKYIYGPVRSRRLGYDLGVTLTPHKVCSFDCLYCQCGPTTEKTSRRKDYLPVTNILEELRSWFAANPEEAGKLKFVTLAGAGEPTLNTGIGGLIGGIKAITRVPVAVITNSSLLSSPDVRSAISGADLIVPSLDAVDPEIFRKIDRPEEGIELEDVIGGLEALRREYRGKIWLEIMLLEGVNDDPAHIAKLKMVVDRIKPDKIQLNSPVRAPDCSLVSVLKSERLDQIKRILGPDCEVL